MTDPLVFSIIIPTYNRPQRLQECLQSLSRLDYPRDRFEVIVVDDGSEIPLAEAIAPFEMRVEPGWFYLKLLSYPFRLRSQQPALLLALLFVWSQIAITFGFFWQWRHQAL